MTKPNPNICPHNGCRRLKGVGLKVCTFHKREHQKSSSPFVYYYGIFRRNARRRGKDFNITLEEYIQFCNENKMFDSKGQKAKNKSIDRIDDSKGYSLDNIQVLTVSENVRKRFVDYFMKQYDNMGEDEIKYYEQKRNQLQNDIEQRKQNDNPLLSF